VDFSECCSRQVLLGCDEVGHMPVGYAVGVCYGYGALLWVAFFSGCLTALGGSMRGGLRACGWVAVFFNACVYLRASDVEIHIWFPSVAYLRLQPASFRSVMMLVM
jgi:hypothetical protein